MSEQLLDLRERRKMRKPRCVFNGRVVVMVKESEFKQYEQRLQSDGNEVGEQGL